MKSIVPIFASILGVGILLTACEDAEEIEITGPALEEILATGQARLAEGSGLRIHGPSSLGGEPLFFINGVRVSDEQDLLADLSPDDIAKITVFKGEKAISLYGPDAEHGVILITLKDSISG